MIATPDKKGHIFYQAQMSDEEKEDEKEDGEQ